MTCAVLALEQLKMIALLVKSEGFISQDNAKKTALLELILTQIC